MRNEKELLIILRDWMLENFETKVISGICQSMCSIKHYDIITSNEYLFLRDNINMCLPPKNKIGYCWKKGALTPRIEFLNGLIDSYDVEQK